MAPVGGGATGPVVLAASSLQESLEKVAAVYAAAGNSRPVISFAATSALARQIEGGAPADLFMSADEEWMDELDKRNLLAPKTRADLLTNSLVVIAPAAAAVDAGDPFAGGGRIALADPQAVPAGRYAAAALKNLGRWDALQSRLVPAENVRAALALVERGEATRGIVYATDAQASAKVAVIYRFPEASHPPIRYPSAQLAASRNAGAGEFLTFLRSPDAAAIFRRHGFGIAAPAAQPTAP